MTQLYFDKKAELDVDRKKQNWILTKKNTQLRVEEKNKKKKPSWNTVLTPTPLQNPPHNPKRSGVCVSTNVRRNERKESRSLI
jgi:hypothetical protein